MFISENNSEDPEGCFRGSSGQELSFGSDHEGQMLEVWGKKRC